MFCRNCGNQLADTAKFCNKCGTPVAKKPEQTDAPVTAPMPIPSTEPAPIPEPVQQPQYQQPSFNQSSEPAPIPEPVQQPQYQQPGFNQSPEPAPIPQPSPMPQFQQPYAQNYQQPAAQPYPQQMNSPAQQAGGFGTGKILGLLTLAVCIFFACSVFIKMYTIAVMDFGAYSYIDRLGEVADKIDKNVFSYSIDVIKNSTWYGACFIIGVWVNLLFAILAVVMMIFALVCTFSGDIRSEVKMWSDLKVTSLFCFLGSFLLLLGVALANIMDNIERDVGIFDDWGCEPGVLVYLIIVLELAVIFFCGHMKRKANAALPQQRVPQPIPPMSPPYMR